MSNSIESLKELGRLVALGIVSFLLTGGLDLILKVFGTELTSEQFLLISGVALALLKSIDKWLHLEGKSREEESGQESVLTTGLTRF